MTPNCSGAQLRVGSLLAEEVQTRFGAFGEYERGDTI